MWPGSAPGCPVWCGAAYEAGPTGYGVARELARRQVGCVVAAPSKIPRGPGARVTTDRREAELLARPLLAGELHPVRVPGREEEPLRDLVRAREAVRVDLMRCRHRLGDLLLRHGIRDEDGDAWTTRDQQWLSTITLAQPAAQATLLDARGAVDALLHRREQLEREIVALLPGSPWSRACRPGGRGASAGSTRCPRPGCAPRSATSPSFRTPAQPISDAGLVPSETSTAQQHRLGSITKTGSKHARRLLVDPAWHYRKRPRTGTTLTERQAGQHPRQSRSPGPRSAACTAPGHDCSNGPNVAP